MADVEFADLSMGSSVGGIVDLDVVGETVYIGDTPCGIIKFDFRITS